MSHSSENTVSIRCTLPEVDTGIVTISLSPDQLLPGEADGAWANIEIVWGESRVLAKPFVPRQVISECKRLHHRSTYQGNLNFGIVDTDHSFKLAFQYDDRQRHYTTSFSVRYFQTTDKNGILFCADGLIASLDDVRRFIEETARLLNVYE